MLTHEENVLNSPSSALDISRENTGVVINTMPLKRKLHIVYHRPALATMAEP